MNHQLEKFKLADEFFSYYNVVGTPKELGQLGKINIFVGPNNSGKSRFMRGIAATKSLEYSPKGGLAIFQNLLEETRALIRETIANNNLDNLGNLESEADSLPNFDFVSEGYPHLKPLRSFLHSITKATSITLKHKSSYNSENAAHPHILKPLKAATESILERLNEALPEDTQPATYRRVYIPTLRSLRILTLDQDILEVRARSDYFESGNDVEIFTGQTLYQKLQELLLGNNEERQSVSKFQDFLSDAFFDGLPVALIPRLNKHVVDVKIGNEEQHPIHNLGDGIQSIIILTFTIFQYRNENLLLFIEEPEQFLHPGMQRLFLSVLMREEFKKTQYFATSHSNHLLDLTLDVKKISVFTFQKRLGDIDQKTTIDVQNVSNEDERSLRLLGIQNSSVFLSNCTIWVEGITDRRYLRHALSLYEKAFPKRPQFRQDLHFSFVEYSGSNITHWSFLDEIEDAIAVERLCGKLFLIADSDQAKGKKAFRLQRLSKKLGDRFHALKCREIENLISPEILAAVVQSYEGTDVAVPIVQQAAYKNKLLGEFIETTLLGGKKSRNGRYKSESGSIADKNKFCQQTVALQKTFDDLSEEAKKLAKTLHLFIESKNTHPAEPSAD